MMAVMTEKTRCVTKRCRGTATGYKLLCADCLKVQIPGEYDLLRTREARALLRELQQGVKT